MQLHVTTTIHLGQQLVFFFLGIDVLGGAASGLDAVQRRLRDIQVSVVDQALHAPEEEGQNEGSDMRAVHIGIGHDYDLLVPDFGRVKFIALAGAHRRYDGPDFLVTQDFVRLLQHPFHVENFAL